MSDDKNLENITKNISDKILDSVYSLEILQYIIDGECKEYFLLSIALKNLNEAFNDVESCRKLISVPE